MITELVNITSGSRLYGTNTDTSDCDETIIYLPSISDILRERKSKQFTIRSDSSNISSPIKAGVADQRFIPFNQFIDQLLEGEAQVLEISCYIASQYIQKNNIETQFKLLVKTIISENAQKIPLNKMFGFVNSKFYQPQPSNKDYYHMFRLLFQLIEFHETGMILFPLKNNIFLKSLKENDNNSVHNQLLNELFNKTKQLLNIKRDMINREAVEENIILFLKQVYSPLWTQET